MPFSFINKPILVKILLIGFVFSLFFPIRHTFFSSQAYLTGAYSDFTSFSLYLSDILLFLLVLAVIIPRGREFFRSIVNCKLSIVCFIIWLILGFLWNYKGNTSLNIWFFIKFLELIVAYGTFKVLFQENGLKMTFFKTFVSLASLQSIIALFQFYKQSSLGFLNKLGESVLNPEMLGVAKIVSDGTKYIRGYGTFPHPNLLSAFLIVGIFISIYLLLNAVTKPAKVLYSLSIFITILGLTVTFSRAGFLAFGIGLMIFFGLLMIKRFDRSFVMIIVIVIVSVVTSLALFHPFLLTRATISDQATVERKLYNQIGIQIVKDNPIFGVGIGESVLHMQQYSKKHLAPWEIQPIHNYFLLSAAELGIIGALILIWIFLSHLKGLWNLLKNQSHFQLFTFHFSLFTILACFLVLMLFDHYFYTLQQTQLLLWLVLGLIAAKIKTSNGSNKTI